MKKVMSEGEYFYACSELTWSDGGRDSDDGELQNAVDEYETVNGLVFECCNTPHNRGHGCDVCFHEMLEAELEEEARRRNK